MEQRCHKTALPDHETALPDLETAPSDRETALPDLETAPPDRETALHDRETTLSDYQRASIKMPCKTSCIAAPTARDMIARGKREARRPWSSPRSAVKA